MPLIDGANDYAKCKGWKKCQREKFLQKLPSHIEINVDTKPSSRKKISRCPPTEELRTIKCYTPREKLPNHF